MLLVPRQLRRVGMTGAVPYYGGHSRGAGVRSISSDCATADICGSDDEWSLRTRGCADSKPAGRSRLASANLSRPPAGIAATPGCGSDHLRGVPAAELQGDSVTGPVQVLVVGFDNPTFSGEVLTEFTRRREAGIVRLIDLLIVSRTEDGTLELPKPPRRLRRILATWLPGC